MVKVFFPNLFMRLIGINTTKEVGTAALRISPKMTKTEVTEYLTKIYNIPVLKVRTANFAGNFLYYISNQHINTFTNSNSYQKNNLYLL